MTSLLPEAATSLWPLAIVAGLLKHEVESAAWLSSALQPVVMSRQATS